MFKVTEELLSVCKVRRELWCVVDPMSAVCQALVMLQLEHLFDQTCESLCDRGEMLLKLPNTSQVCSSITLVGFVGFLCDVCHRKLQVPWH